MAPLARAGHFITNEKEGGHSMLIFLQDSFVTISQDANQRDRFMIRARVAGDIEKLFPKAAQVWAIMADMQDATQ
jgi:hypothetical protein